MKKIFLSLLAILTLCTLARGANGKDYDGSLPADIEDSAICKEWTYTTVTWNGTGDVIPFYDDCQTNVHFTMNSVGSNDYETFIFEFWDDQGDYATCVGQNNIWGGGSVNPPIMTKQPCIYTTPVTGDYTLSIAKISDNDIRVYVDYPDNNQDLIWNFHYDNGTPSTTYLHMGGEMCIYTISKIDFTEVDIADKTVIKFYDKNETFVNWDLNKDTDGLNSNLTVDEFAILDGYETTVNLTLNSVGTADFHTFAFEIYDAVGKYTTCLGNNNYWGDYTYTKIVPNIYADVTDEYTVSVAKIGENIIRFHVVLPTGTTTMWNETNSSYEYNVTLPESFTMYADYSASGGNSVATSFHMGGESCSYTINSITFTENTPTAISNVNVPVFEVARYNVLGQRIVAPQRGINIIKYSDGSTKKVLVK